MDATRADGDLFLRVRVLVGPGSRPVISNAVREEVRARTDLADLVGQYVPLRKSGASFVARCPFHQEKSPSFHVSRDRGLYYCFGCKASGDIFTFYERVEGVSFPEALRSLAMRCGVEIVEEDRDPQKHAEEKRAREVTERLHQACELAAQFYVDALATAELHELAHDELARRTIGADVTEQFRLGYAPASWSALADHFKKHGVSPADAELAGLIVPRKSGGGSYDRFRHRLMFPIFDRHGKVVAFSGRVLPVTADMPEGLVPEDAGKYINSPETPIYKKGELLFGLQVARMAMRQKAEAIVVEGNFDVVAMHQGGFAETVAPLGTSFTDGQARLLRRFAESVALVFDGDEAGRKAARAAFAVCAKAGLIARVVVLPNGRDPDEVLRDPTGREFLAEKIKHAPAIVEWLVGDTAAHCGDNTPARIGALRSLAPVFAGVSDLLERDVYVEQSVRLLHVSERQVQQAIREAENEARARQHNPFIAKPAYGPKAERDEPFRKKPVEANDGATGGDAAARAPERRVDPASKATAEAIDALLRTPSLLSDDSVETLLPLLDAGFAQPLVAEARRQWLSRGELDGPALIAVAPSDKARAWISERIVPQAETEAGHDDRNRQALLDSVTRLRTLRDQDSAKTLQQESARAGASGDQDLELRLLRQKQLIDKQRVAAAKKNRGAA